MLRKEKLQAFTLIELLVVITILAIISVVAYTNFSGSTDKAKNSKKLNDISSIETGLNMYFQDKNYYPMPSQLGATNLWGYDDSATAQINNTLGITLDGDQIVSITGVGGGKVFASGSATNQIGAKGTLDSGILSKQYLSQELADPSIKDIKVGEDKTMKDFGIGEYVYGVYAKLNTAWDSTSKKGSAYNIAMTIKDEQKGYITKIIGNFDKDTCLSCPNSLIGDGTTNNNLLDGESSMTGAHDNPVERIPYPIQF